MADWLIDWLIDWLTDRLIDWSIDWLIDRLREKQYLFLLIQIYCRRHEDYKKGGKMKGNANYISVWFPSFFIVIVVNCFDCICFFAWCTLKLKPGLSGPSWPVQNESLFPSFAISKKPYCFYSKTPTLQSLYRNSRGTNGQYRDPLFLLNLNDIDEVCLGHSEKIMALLCDFTLVIYRWFGISSTVWVIFWRTAR